MSAPRAGSTLLFETLSRHPQLHTIGGESHALIEHIPALSTVARGYVSNRLDESDASKDIIDLLHTRFTQAAKDAFGRPLAKQATSFRLLEKTPKNALRVSFFNKVFKDALFIFLVRDPRENISSIMEAWRSKRFITYPNLPNNLGDWSLLLPDGWQSTIGQTLASKATFQWQAANQSILDGLAKVPRERQLIVNYESLITQPKESIELILSFAGLNVAAAKTMLQNGLPLSRYTITKPAPNKWHTNASQMAKPVESIASLAQDLNEKLLTNAQKPVDYQIKIPPSANAIALTAQKPSIGKVSRNAPCPCGSQQKYKHCHGQLT